MLKGDTKFISLTTHTFLRTSDYLISSDLSLFFEYILREILLFRLIVG